MKNNLKEIDQITNTVLNILKKDKDSFFNF
jgi:hypothetical protein